MENSTIINGNCWLALFDILGFSDMVKRLPPEFVIGQYKEALNEAKKHVAGCRFKFFSDSFIFYTENDSQDSFCGIAAASEFFFRKMFRKEIPMRGCLTVGQFYADEENGMFFGPALIHAHELAEGQNWIGFVLSEKTREKSGDGITNNPRHYNYLEYDVPCKQKPKRRKLLVYYPNILITESYTNEASSHHQGLLMALGIMEYFAKAIHSPKGNTAIGLEERTEYERIIAKYENTRTFLETAYPKLRKRFEQKYPEPAIIANTPDSNIM
jgi:hypothetical protein